MTAARMGTAAAGAGGGDGPRPMTSVKGAGFQSRALGTSAGGKPVNPLDAVAARTGGPAPPLADKAENSPEEAAKEMELKVHALIEACAKAAAGGDFVMALERAKEAGRKERQLVKFKDGNGLADSISMDLTYCCAFNLAHAVSASAGCCCCCCSGGCRWLFVQRPLAACLREDVVRSVCVALRLHAF